MDWGRFHPSLSWQSAQGVFDPFFSSHTPMITNGSYKHYRLLITTPFANFFNLHMVLTIAELNKRLAYIKIQPKEVHKQLLFRVNDGGFWRFTSSPILAPR
jgi:hypothetical protein